jgi:hypothetical protein
MQRALSLGVTVPIFSCHSEERSDQESAFFSTTDTPTDGRFLAPLPIREDHEIASATPPLLK